MKLPPLRTGTCLIGNHRYPAIVGKVQGRTREMFVCGLHVDRFLGALPPAELRQSCSRTDQHPGGRRIAL